MTIGFRIRPITDRVDPALCERAKKIPAANIGDVMNRMQSMRGGFRAFGGLRTIAGPAFTVRAWPGDNLMLHRAVDMAEPGDIIVCDGGGGLDCALMGDLMLGHATARGIQGVVMDGAVRDIAELAQMKIGVWARGHTPAGPTKEGPGEIGTTLACGGLSVAPGDLIVADEDGVVVVPRAEAAAVIATAEAHQAKETAITAAIRGAAWDRGWVGETLRAKGCEGA
jgi:RraA family protein